METRNFATHKLWKFTSTNYLIKEFNQKKTASEVIMNHFHVEFNFNMFTNIPGLICIKKHSWQWVEEFKDE